MSVRMRAARWSPLRRMPSSRCSLPDDLRARSRGPPGAEADGHPRRRGDERVDGRRGGGGAAAVAVSGGGLLRAPVALLGGLARDAQAVGDRAPGRARDARAGDGVALEPVEPPRSVVIARRASSGSSAVLRARRRAPWVVVAGGHEDSWPTHPPGDSSVLQCSVETEAVDLDRRAAVHDDREPGRAGAVGGGLVDDAELHPDGARADRDRLVDVRPGGVGPAEDVDDVDDGRVVEVGQPSRAAFAVDLGAGRLRGRPG